MRSMRIPTPTPVRNQDVNSTHTHTSRNRQKKHRQKVEPGHVAAPTTPHTRTTQTFEIQLKKNHTHTHTHTHSNPNSVIVSIIFRYLDYAHSSAVKLHSKRAPRSLPRTGDECFRCRGCSCRSRPVRRKTLPSHTFRTKPCFIVIQNQLR